MIYANYGLVLLSPSSAAQNQVRGAKTMPQMSHRLCPWTFAIGLILMALLLACGSSDASEDRWSSDRPSRQSSDQLAPATETRPTASARSTPAVTTSPTALSAGATMTVPTIEPAATGNPTSTETSLRIAFSSDRDGNHEIYVMNSDGSDQTRLTDTPGGITLSLAGRRTEAASCSSRTVTGTKRST